MQEMQQPKPIVDIEQIRSYIAPVLAAHGVELVDILWTSDRSGWILRLTIERVDAPFVPDGVHGVTLEDCVEVSRDSSAALDAADVIAPRYHLEVSSPGLDRPLRTAKEFARFVGQTVKVKLSKPASDGQRVLRGKLAAANDGKVAVEVDGKRLEAPLDHVVEAHLVFELEAQPKKGPRAQHAKGPRGPKR